MRLKLTAMALIAAAAGGSACAMTGPATNHELRCSVVDADRLAPAIGGEEPVCATIREAVGASGHGASVVVRVLGPSRAMATVTTAGGRELTPINVAASDSVLTIRSLQMLAEGVAGQLASVGKD